MNKPPKKAIDDSVASHEKHLNAYAEYDIARQVRLQQQMGMVNYAGMAELPPVVSDVREVKFKVVETEDRKHFIITAGCKTAIVHDFQEAESEVRKMFKREYKGFFEKEMK